MKVIFRLLVIALFFTACKNESSKTTDQTAAESEKVVAVCVSNGVPVRAVPEKNGKYLTSLNLGETMMFLGDTVADSTDTKKVFYKVELSDGKVAWARTYGVIINGVPAAILTETPIYKRPDLVNKTDKNFYPLEFIVISNEKDEWVKVTGASKKKSGWILRKSLTDEAVEVAVATLAQRTLLDEKGKIITDKASEFIEELPYENSKLGAYVQMIFDEQIQAAIEEEIIDMQEEDQEDGIGYEEIVATEE